MRTNWVLLLVVLMLFSGVIAVEAGQGARGAGPCDRACLQGFVDRYLDAWIARDPKRLPLTANAKYTENGQRLEFGDGSWNVATGKGKYRLWVPDTETGQVGVITTVTEDGADNGPNVASMLALRLKVVNRQISEAEALFVRPATGGGGARGAAPARGATAADGAAPARGGNAAGGAGPARGGNAADGAAPARGAAPATPLPPPAQRLETMGTPNPIFLQPIPPAERMSRADLIRVANMYFSGMQKNDGLGEYPFTSDCDRFENAGQTTNRETPPNQIRPDPKTATMYSAEWSCMEQFKSGLIHFVTRIRDRRYVAVDPEFGMVYSFAFFDHMAGKTRTYTHPDGRVITGGPTSPWTWEIAELFRIEKGKIRRIEAILVQSPYGQQSGWSTYEESMSDKARDIR
jgi:hypothetical protein